MNDEKYIGLDVHQATIVVAVLDSTGKLVMESILETKAATILHHQFFQAAIYFSRSTMISIARFPHLTVVRAWSSSSAVSQLLSSDAQQRGKRSKA